MITYKAENLETISQDFYNATGVNLSILNEAFAPLQYRNTIANNPYCGCIQATQEGNLRCDHSDWALLDKCRKSKVPEMHVCHAGLVDIAIPILHLENIIGYIILGQIKNNQDFTQAAEKVKHLFPDLQPLEKIYNNLPYFDDRKVDSIANVAVMLAKYILLENMLQTQQNRNLDRVLAYIDAHLTEPIHINALAASTFVSKSTLYNLFATHFRCTISEYVNARRVNLAAEMLLTSDLSIDEIARNCGFSGGAYFCRVFKNQKGTSPLQYRKTHIAKP